MVRPLTKLAGAPTATCSSPVLSPKAIAVVDGGYRVDLQVGPQEKPGLIRETVSVRWGDGTALTVPVAGIRREKAWERKGGAGLLGFSKSAEASPPLRRMAESEADPGARLAAYRALGRTRDASNLSYLQEAQRAWEAPAPKDKPIPMQAETLKAIRAALQQLRQEIAR